MWALQHENCRSVRRPCTVFTRVLRHRSNIRPPSQGQLNSEWAESKWSCAWCGVECETRAGQGMAKTQATHNQPTTLSMQVHQPFTRQRHILTGGAQEDAHDVPSWYHTCVFNVSYGVRRSGTFYTPGSLKQIFSVSDVIKKAKCFSAYGGRRDVFLFNFGTATNVWFDACAEYPSARVCHAAQFRRKGRRSPSSDTARQAAASTERP